MEDVAVGRVIRAIRRRRGLRQADVAASCDVSQQSISQLERGRIEHVSLAAARRVARALEVELAIEPKWRGPSLAQLLDQRHAAVVDVVVQTMQACGFEVLVEYSFSHFGERGAVDVLGWTAARRALVIVEVKTRIVDLQDLLGAVDRKRRLVPLLVARDRGWQPASIGTLIVLPESSTTRDAVSRHAATFAVAFPGRNVAVRKWLRTPVGELRAVWFVRDTSQRCLPRSAGDRIRAAAPRR